MPVLRLIALLASCAVALVACGGSDPAAPVAPQEEVAAGGHIHGLGIDPADGSLFVATHTGLFRAAPDEPRAARVGDTRQDTMGFTVVGPGRFLGSGHPDAQQNLPPLLGLIRSDDAGRSWEPVSLLGEADFHVLRAAGKRIYGLNATDGQLHVSGDGGRTWARRSPPATVIDLVADPADPDRVVASTQDGLHLSRDGGARWRALDGGAPGYLAWTAKGLFLVDGAGTVHSAQDPGGRWRPVGETGGQPAAFAAHQRDLYAALHSGEVKVSQDGGRTWRPRTRI